MTLFQDLDATALAAEIRAGRLSAEEAVLAAIERIEQLDPALNAVVAVRFDEALAEVGAGLPDGPLTGVPTLVKSLGADVAGLPTTRGSRLWADDVKHADSELVRRYRRAGLVVLGMTNTPELGKNASTDPDLHGSTPNPRSPRHTVGGSSGGSAAAVATGMVPVAHANDGGGSIRIPAVVNGLFGLKPSRGRVSPAPYPSSFAAPNGVQHALTRTVRDSALLLDVAAGSLAGDVFGFGAGDGARRTDPQAGPGAGGPFSEAVRREPGRLRVGLIESLRNGPDVDPECVAAVRGAAVLLESLGHEVSPMAAPWDSTHVAATSGLLMGVSLVGEVDGRLARLGRELREDDLEPFTRVLLDHYRTTTGARLHEALEAVQLIAWQVGSAFDDVDVLLSPVMCVPTPEIGFWDTRRPETMYERGVLSSAFTTVFNLSGMPAMAVPYGTDSRGLPIGFQAAAPLGREDVLLSLAAQVERAAPWPLLVGPV